VSTVGSWLADHADLDRRDREVLLCRAAGLRRAQVLADPERPLEAAAAATLRGWAERRRNGEPVAYIVGEREFWGLALGVSPAVLVPRPETELLVEVAIDAMVEAGNRPRLVGESRSGDRCHGRTDRFDRRHLSGTDPSSSHADGCYGAVRVLDLGTGSGALAIALALEAEARALPVEVCATDVCAEALAVAAANGRRHGAEVAWLRSDWFDGVRGRFDLIVSNPPYVAEDDPHLEALGYEPRGALAAGADGLDAIRAIVAAAPGYLLPSGVLLLEHGYDQGAAVRALLAGAGFRDVETLPDLAGLDRVTRARRQRRCR
jgi:release factor glutamine methyltransferase